MTNIRKYGSVPQRERLSMIRSGNTDVYNSEIQGIGELRKQYELLGLSTTDIDDWEKTVNNAYSVSATNAKSEALSGIPKYRGGKYAQINSALNKSLGDLKANRDESIKTARSDAESTLKYVGEWLANNGYSDKGYLSAETRKKVEDALKKVLENIDEQYKRDVNSTRSSYRSMVM